MWRLSRNAGKLATQLQQEIDCLSEAYGGPTFPPHITLVGGITGSEENILETAKKLAAAVKVQFLVVSWTVFTLPTVISISSICVEKMSAQCRMVKYPP